MPSLPPRASLTWLRKTAKDHLRMLRAAQPSARLADAQLAVARDHGFRSWRAMKAHIDALPPSSAPGAPADAAPSHEGDAEVRQFFRLVATGTVDTVRARLDAEPDLRDAIGPHPFWDGRPQALHVAVESGADEAFDLLLARGANVDGRNAAYADWSPLMLAAHRGRTRMRDALLAHGARVGLPEALLLGDDARLADLLAGGAAALPASVGNDGSLLTLARTPLAVDRLLALGVPADARDRWGSTPMDAFSRLGPRGRPLIAALLARGVAAAPVVHARLGDVAALEAARVRQGADVTADDVLLAAVGARQHDAVAWLLAHGASANARATARSRHTALHEAAWNGDRRMVDLLLAAGADIHARDDEHDSTPRGWAETSATISRNADAAAIAAHLASLGA